MIPILIICFNNHRYVENTIKNIERVNRDDLQRIRILNNSSTRADTIAYLGSCGYTVFHRQNNGPRINKQDNRDLYDTLPNQFIMTDPDLEFNKNLPSNYVEILSTLATEYRCGKIGFALDLSDYDKMYHGGYLGPTTINQWESIFWRDRIENPTYELYNASIDTTFCLVDKTYMADNHFSNNIRVAGCFTAKHLPWYRENALFNIYDNYVINSLHESKISTIAGLIRSHTEENYNRVVTAGNDYMLVNKTVSLSFTQTDLFDKVLPFLFPDRDVIDIGGGRVDVTVYMSRRVRRVYVLNGDETQYTILKNNCSNVLFVKELPLLDEVSLVRFGKTITPVIIG